MTANRLNRRWQNPASAVGEKPVPPLGSQRANSPSWSRAFGTTQRPDTREQSTLPPKNRPLANEEESIHAEGFRTGLVQGGNNCTRLHPPIAFCSDPFGNGFCIIGVNPGE